MHGIPHRSNRNLTDEKTEMGDATGSGTLHHTLWREVVHLHTQPSLAVFENPRQPLQMLCRGVARRKDTMQIIQTNTEE